MNKTNIINSLINKLWMLFAGILLLLALVVVVGRELLAELPGWRGDIEALVEEKTGLVVTFGKLAGEMRGLTPVVTASQLAIHLPETDEPSYVQQVEIRLDLFRSMLARQVRLNALSIEGISLQVEQDPASGKWKVNGFPLPAGTPTAMQGNSPSVVAPVSDPRSALAEKLGPVLALLHDPQQITMDHLDVELNVPGIAVQRLQDVALQLANEGDEHQLSLLLRVIDEGAALPLKAVVRYEGVPLSREEVSADLYLEASQADVTHWLESRSLQGYRAQHVAGDVALWGRIEAGELHELQGQFALQQLVIQHPDSSPLEMEYLGARARLVKDDQDWELQINDAALNLNGYEAMIPGAVISYRELQADFSAPQQQPPLTRQWLVGLASLDLGLFPKLHALLPPELQTRLSLVKAIDPAGVLKRLRLEWKQPVDLPAQWQFSSEFENLGVNAYEKIPGLKGLSGFLAMGPQQGVVDLQSGSTEFFIQRTYERPFSVDFLQGPLAWKKNEEGVITVSSGLILAGNEDAQARALLGIRVYPKNLGRIPEASVIAEIFQGNVANTEKYIPHKKIPDGLEHFLASGILSGKTPYLRILHEGPIKIPVDERHLRTFQIGLQAENVDIRFLPDWPIASQVSGDLLLDDRAFYARQVSGTLFDARIHDATLEVPYRPGKSPVLKIQGKATGTVADVASVLADTGLRKVMPQALLNWEGAGPVNAGIGLAIPLTGDGAVEGTVALDFQQAALREPELQLALDNVTGQVVYDIQNGATSPDLTATLWGKTWQGSIDTVATGAGRQIEIHGRGGVDCQQVFQWTQLAVLEPCHGESEMDAALVFPFSDQEAYLRVTSNLQGIEIEAPDPVGKEASSELPTELTLTLGGERKNLSIHYGHRFAGVLQFDENGPLRGRFESGTELPHLPQLEALFLKASVDHLHVENWLDFISHLENVDEQLAQRETESAQVPVEPASSVPLVERIGELSLAVKQLNAFDMHLQDVQLELTRKQQAWSIDVVNDWLSGNFQVPDDYDVDGQTPMSINLGYLSWNTDTMNGIDGKAAEADTDTDTSHPSNSNAPSSTPELEPADIPPMLVDIQQVVLDGTPQGRWRFRVIPEPDNRNEVNFSELDITYNDIHVFGANRWRKTPQGLENVFNGVAEATDLPAVMKHWDYDPIARARLARVAASVSWPGLPSDIVYDNVTGSLNLRMEDGYLLNVDSKTSAMRVFGLVNMKTWSRRLKLDFSDLYEKGLAFDKIKGMMEIDRGILSTPALTMEAPSAEFGLSGTINLVDETLDTRLNVTLPVRRTAYVACLAGPAACAGVFIGERVLGDRIEKFTTLNYRVYGSWDDPVVKELSKVPIGAPVSATRKVGEGISQEVQKNMKSVQKNVKAVQETVTDSVKNLRDKVLP